MIKDMEGFGPEGQVSLAQDLEILNQRYVEICFGPDCSRHSVRLNQK